MVKILISPKMEHNEDWHPIKNIKIDVLIKDVWDKYIENSPIYENFKFQFGKLSCDCNYPTSRPINPELFDFYNGCLFDLDAYLQGKYDYLIEEVESIPEEVLAGGISKTQQKMLKKIPVKSLYSNVITDEIEVALYLKMILYLVRRAVDPEYNSTAKKLIDQ